MQASRFTIRIKASNSTSPRFLSLSSLSPTTHANSSTSIRQQEPQAREYFSSKMNTNSSTSSTGMRPPAARNQEKNDATSAAAAMALAGLQSVPTSSSSSADGGNNGGQQTGERSNASGRNEEQAQAQALEISKSFPQIVSRSDISDLFVLGLLTTPKGEFAFSRPPRRTNHGPA